MEDLKDARVLVTGSDGFIGSHVVEELVRAGANVKAVVLYNSFNSWGWLDTVSADVMKSVEVIAGDVRDPHFMIAAAAGCTDVMHLAALIAIPFSYRRARLLCRNQRPRHGERPAGRPPCGRAPLRPDLDQRSLWQRAIRADQGKPSAGRAIALLGIEDRVRPDGAVVSCLLRHAGGRRQAVQHLWAAPIGARGDPDHHQPDRCRASARSASARSARRATSRS